MAIAQQIGSQAEKQAIDYLRQQGLILIISNYRCRVGEIDLIMKDKDTIVFIEVRYRNKITYGSGAETITAAKKNKILRSALHYLQKNNLLEKISCRFDVISMTQNKEISWIKNAFEKTY